MFAYGMEAQAWAYDTLDNSNILIIVNVKPYVSFPHPSGRSKGFY